MKTHSDRLQINTINTMNRAIWTGCRYVYNSVYVYVWCDVKVNATT